MKQMKEEKKLYLHFDGDGIGSIFNDYLRKNKIDQVSNLSDNLNDAFINLVEEYLHGNYKNPKIINRGGDELVIEITITDDKKSIQDVLKNVKIQRRKFYDLTGYTISVGVGYFPSDALLGKENVKRFGTEIEYVSEFYGGMYYFFDVFK